MRAMFPEALDGQFVIEKTTAYGGVYTKVGSHIAGAKSAYQAIQVIDTPEYGRILRLDGHMMTSERDGFYYHENLIHVPAIAHAGPNSALIIGGGDGGAAREILRYRSVHAVHLVEIDAMVIEFSKKHLPAVHGGAFDDPRLEVHIEDGRAWTERSPERYDLIVLDLTDPVGPSRPLYTVEFYELCRSRLNAGGILALHVESPVSRPSMCRRIVKRLRAVFPCVRPYLVFVPAYGTWLGMATASMAVDPARLTEDEVAQRLVARQVTGLQYYNPSTHRAVFALPNCIRDALAAGAHDTPQPVTRGNGNGTCVASPAGGSLT